MNDLERILDANRNRAREGLRMLEDLARFTLDDALLSSMAKLARHRLAELVDALPVSADALLAARDTPGDVGTSISTESERARPDRRSMAVAAAGRTCEALRVLEETAKALGCDPAPFEALRYTVYDLEQQLVLKLRPACPQWTLCVLITESLCSQHPWLEVARLAIAGGADCLQLREKSLPAGEIALRARALIDLAQPAGAAVIINDRPDIAAATGADGVHLGRDDLSIADARSIVGPLVWIGASTSTVAQAQAAIGAGADSCGLGPMFETTTKHKPTIAGPAYAEDYLANPACSATPHLAIGGITPGNLDQLAAVGVRGVAVSSAVCTAADPKAAAAQIVERLDA